MKLTTWIAIIVTLIASLIYNQSHALVLQQSQQDTAFSSQSAELININTADVKTLSTLPGLGEKKAQAIIDYRERNGNFKDIQELVNVKGIGEKLMQKLVTRITV